MARPHAVVALFHSVHRTRSQARSGALAPNQEVTVDDLRRFLDAMLGAGYRVARSEQFPQCTPADRKLLLLTFDDGYYNNTLALPVLEEFHAPATFFITTSHVLSGKAFWWDAVARRLAATGKSRAAIHRALERMKSMPVALIEQRLRCEAGAAALEPCSDADRPLAPGELRDLARSAWVSLGNHTADHTILTRCSHAESARAIAAGRDDLEALTGSKCRSIAYPNGEFSRHVIEAARESGHEVGFTCVAKANPISQPGEPPLTLGRHLIWGGVDYRALVPQLAAAWLPGASLRSALRQLLAPPALHRKRAHALDEHRVGGAELARFARNASAAVDERNLG